jgi:cytochrome oxidase Cu insertion factor (SCO1/SenC/PrrC family)
MDDYTVDHTIFFYLMGPDGLIRNYFGQQMTSEEVSAGVLHAIYEDIEMVKGPTLWSMVMGK